MVEIVEHAILHIRRLIFSFIVDRRSPLVPLQGTEGSRVPQHDLIFLHHDFCEKSLKLNFQSPYYGGNCRACNFAY